MKKMKELKKKIGMRELIIMRKIHNNNNYNNNHNNSNKFMNKK